MILGTRYLVDIRSGTFKGIADRIRNLEYSEYLTIVYDRPEHGISIELPRFRLSFFLNEGELESKNMHGMIIDENQSTGTMIGLSSQLVLRHKDPTFASLPRSRHVLIPYGDIHFSLSRDHHVRVRIDTRTKRQVIWHKYEVDSDLGLLVGNVNLTSRLYRIYLHALCSHPLPDPLTSQTGTDHALQELNAAGCFSFQRLTKADVELLQLIGNITPCRQYYPKHLRVMQTTDWSPELPALSQHGAFEPAVRSILKYAQSFPELKDEEVVLDYDHKGDFFLMARAMRRNAVYYEGGLDIPLARDQKYSSRDSPHAADHDSNGIQAMNVSRLVFAWPVGPTRYLGSSEILQAFEGWGYMSGVVPNASLKYTKEWLNLDLSKKWLTIYDLCRQIDRGTSKFELVFSFSALAYGMSSSWKFIPVLLAFATMHSFQFVDPPPHLSYELADGFDAVEEQVRRIIVSGERKNSYYHNLDSDVKKKNSTVDNAVHYLMNQQRRGVMPLQSPFNQSDTHWLETESIMSDVARYFASCSHNRDLRSFASRITDVLKTHPLEPSDVHPSRFQFNAQFDVSHSGRYSALTFATLLSSRIPPHFTHNFGRRPEPIDTSQLEKLRSQFKDHHTYSVDTSHLEKLISQFKCHHAHSDFTQRYSERLEKSRGELHGLPSCLAYRNQCERHLHDILSEIRSSLEPSTVMDHILAKAGLWPRIHPRAMLHPLASASSTQITCQWIESLTTFAWAFIEYQFSQRLVTYVHRSEFDNFFKELDNASFNLFDERGNPDWLLIQVRMDRRVIDRDS